VQGCISTGAELANMQCTSSCGRYITAKECTGSLQKLSGLHNGGCDADAVWQGHFGWYTRATPTWDSTPVSVFLLAAHDTTFDTTSSALDSAGAAAATTCVAMVKLRSNFRPSSGRGVEPPPRRASKRV
jgi:hypothetical protein